jgi:hypothetical protein
MPMKNQFEMEKAINHINTKAEALANRIADQTIQEAKKQVPVLTGFLRDSHYVRSATKQGTVWTAVFGASAPYAIYVHERSAGRGFKWLRNALSSVAARFNFR